MTVYRMSAQLNSAPGEGGFMAVHRLHGAGLQQGNLGRYLFFEIGKQRDERHLIESWCRLKSYGHLP
jgi:hypothetical protein